MRIGSSEEQLEAFIRKYPPEIGAGARSALTRLRALLPNSVEFVYDKYNALVVGFGPTEKPSEALLALAIYPRRLNLVFLHGASLRDPQRMLAGSGKRVRHIRLESSDTLEKPAVRSLISQSIALAGKPFDEDARKVLIRSVSGRNPPFLRR